MSATPIPRTLTMTIYGDMDLSIIKEKPKFRKEVKTYTKLESKIDEIIKFVKKEIKNGNQIFWVCPLIDESKKIDHSSAIIKFKFLDKIFPKKGVWAVGFATKENTGEMAKKTRINHQQW